MSGRKKETLRVLLLSGAETRTGSLREILDRHAELVHTGSLEEVRQQLARTHFDVLLCDWSFPGGTWQDTLQEVQRRYPGLPTIIVNRLAEERDWVEVLEAGAFDLMSAPYTERAVLSVLEHAVASYEGRMRTRSVA